LVATRRFSKALEKRERGEEDPWSKKGWRISKKKKNKKARTERQRVGGEADRVKQKISPITVGKGLVSFGGKIGGP